MMRYIVRMGRKLMKRIGRRRRKRIRMPRPSDVQVAEMAIPAR